MFVTTAPKVRSLALPPAFSSRLPVAVTAPPPASVSMAPASVTITRFPSESTSESARSGVSVSVVPSAPTCLTLIAFSVPICSPVDSVRYRPPVPVLLMSAASLATLTSRWFAPVPAPSPATALVVKMRSSSALTFTVSEPLPAKASVIVEPLRLTSPVVVTAPSAIALVASTRTLPLPVDSVAPWVIVTAAACTSSVPAPDVRTSAFAARARLPGATKLMWPPPLTTSALAVMLLPVP